MLVEEANFQQTIQSVEPAMTHRVGPTDSMSIYKKSQSDGDFGLQSMSTLSGIDVHILPDQLKNLLEESRAVKDLSDIENAHLVYLDTIVQYDEAIQDDKKESL